MNCQGHTKTGAACKSSAALDNGYCRMHQGSTASDVGEESSTAAAPTTNKDYTAVEITQAFYQEDQPSPDMAKVVADAISAALAPLMKRVESLEKDPGLPLWKPPDISNMKPGDTRSKSDVVQTRPGEPPVFSDGDVVTPTPGSGLQVRMEAAGFTDIKGYIHDVPMQSKSGAWKYRVVFPGIGNDKCREHELTLSKAVPVS